MTDRMRGPAEDPTPPIGWPHRIPVELTEDELVELMLLASGQIVHCPNPGLARKLRNFQITAFARWQG
jgi:hypothetical protein